MAARRITLITLALLFAGLLNGCSSNAGGTGPDHALVVIAGEPFNLELALDDAARFQGLSGRKEIAPDGGMLFVFPEPIPLAFVMRDCYVPIDIIFVDPTGRVVNTHRMTLEPPGTPESGLKKYSSKWAGQFAIELRGGTLDRLKINEGDKVELPLEDLKHRAR
ncbi:MAG: DUF192 domain-containing protein [Planctomycetes bacterium]|nr:DUF192 domain-containing protein [Planctomycetota bacterium]